MAYDEFEKELHALDEDLNLDEVGSLFHGANLEELGTVLRAHLLVEHFLTEHLERRNPNLRNLRKVRLGFHLKMQLLDTEIPFVKFLLPGIDALNAIRNRMGHRLDHRVSDEETLPFFDQRNQFRRYLEMRFEARDEASLTPVEKVQAFAELAALILRTTTVAYANLERARGVLERRKIELEVTRQLIEERRQDEADEEE